MMLCGAPGSAVRLRTIFAARHMAAECRRATALDGRHHLRRLGDHFDIGDGDDLADIAKSLAAVRSRSSVRETGAFLSVALVTIDRIGHLSDLT